MHFMDYGINDQINVAIFDSTLWPASNLCFFVTLIKFGHTFSLNKRHELKYDQSNCNIISVNKSR